MEIVYSIKPLLAVMASLAVVPIIVSSRSENTREMWTFIAGGIKLVIVASMVPAVLNGAVIEQTLVDVLPGIAIKFRVDSLGLLFALVASSLWIVTSVYSVGYMRGLQEHSQTRYFSFFALSLSATIGVAFSANLLTLYLFYEMLSFSTYPLVTHHQDEKARSSGRKYLFYILGSSIGLVLPAMLYIYYVTGTLEFTALGMIPGGMPKGVITALLVMFVFGFAKAAIMPFHSWLPAAMVAPTPVSALLHAVAVVKVGAFSVVRIITGVFGSSLLTSTHLDTWLCIIASFTIIVSSLIALTQDELKRRLAFSTIGQLSYIVLGVSLFSLSGVTGGILHIAMHAFGKITLFFCAGAIFVATGIKHISDMEGLGKRMPVTMAAFFVGSLSVIGLPPCGGFISKWYIVIGTVEADRLAMLAVILTSSFLNAAYFLPVVYKAFFSKKNMVSGEGMKEAPVWCLVPLVLTAAISIILFFFPQPFMDLAELSSNAFIGGP